MDSVLQHKIDEKVRAFAKQLDLQCLQETKKSQTTNRRMRTKIKEIKFIDLFAGIGGIRLGVEQACKENGIKCKCVFSSEIDKFACQTYEANFHEKPSGDITKIKEQDIPSFDMLCAGFPCQPFSIAGKQKGFEDTRGTMFFEIARIVKYHRPKIVFLENVKNLLTHDKGRTFAVIKQTLEDLGYFVNYKVLNAKDFGVPQNRERIYIVCFKKDDFEDCNEFEFPEKTGVKTKLSDILDKEVDKKYTITDHLWEYLKNRKTKQQAKGNGFGYSLFDDDAIYTRTISARYYKDGSEILIKQKDKNPRRLTPREATKLQGFPNDFKIVVSDLQMYKQCGNSVAVPVIKSISENICLFYKKYETK